MFYFCVMKLTDEENRFMEYWEQNRTRKRRTWQHMIWGLPLGIILVVATFANFLSGWYRRADMQFRADSSGFVVLLLAAIGIIVFIAVFSARHRWDQHEQRYRELQARKEKN